MNVTTHIVAPHTHFARNEGIIGALDRLFREHRVPPAIVQYSFVDRRPANRYNELVYILTPFSTRPTSELLEDIGHTVAPAQARFTTLLSSHYPPVYPPLPAAPLYAQPNEEDFIVARSPLRSADGCRGRVIPDGFQPTFESTLVIDSTEFNQIKSTLSASYTVKACHDKPNTATLTITCPTATLHHRVDSHRHSYALHSLSVTARQGPNGAGSAGCTITPHFTPRDPRFERTCNSPRHEFTWIWEVLDKELRANGFTQCAGRKAPVTAPGLANRNAGVAAGESGNMTNGDTETRATHTCCPQRPISSTSLNGCPNPCSSQPPTENIAINVPISSTSTPAPLCITFTATLTSTAGLDAIDAVHRTSQWADPQAVEGLQSAFDKVHPAVQVVHHVVRVEIPDVGEMIRTGLGCGSSNGPSTDAEDERLGGPEIGVYAQRRESKSYFGELRFTPDRDAGVVGRRGDEDEETSSDEEGL
ncbi:hypothetical protein RSOLAG22IIIB_08120 [Rhizoctonia solani]|uniref:Uncharacterized protein n=1 Tax=Rhizoctonia solani TaxID=456999 RepID=A0A0K6FRQ9_9AGAM|nr:hypothetical protein RSOLAG22IIIB_08120 [Rhizoctonia solani]